ncbi:MAG: large subunit ribosomal protein [Thermoleophilaceae bacterium]|nr:large subunit ribosomal protein [Thermoleophilaceae bacterium]
MNREQKAAVIDRVADEIRGADAIFAVDYRGLSVKQAKQLRVSLGEAGASLQVVKNTLAERSADAAGAEDLKVLLDGPTAFTFVRGDAALAAKAIATFRKAEGLPEFKGGQMNGETLSIDQIESIARLPARELLQAQFVGVLASPITGLVRGLGSMVSGLAIALGQIRDQGLVGGDEPEPAPEPEPAAAEAPAAEPEAEEAPAAEPEAEAEEAPAADEPEASEAPGDPAAEAEAAEAETTTSDDAPSEGGDTESEEG